MAIDLLKLYAARRNSRGFAYKNRRISGRGVCRRVPFHGNGRPTQMYRGNRRRFEKHAHYGPSFCGRRGLRQNGSLLPCAPLSRWFQTDFRRLFSHPRQYLPSSTTTPSNSAWSIFDVKVACLNRFRTAAEQKKIIKRAVGGEK